MKMKCITYTITIGNDRYRVQVTNLRTIVAKRNAQKHYEPVEPRTDEFLFVTRQLTSFGYRLNLYTD